MQTTASSLPEFAAPFTEPDDVARDKLLEAHGQGDGAIDALARDLIGAVRSQPTALADIEELLREYALTSKEGLALMVLAEALLRVPDAATADRLIEDTLGQADFARHVVKSHELLVTASAWALGVGARIVHPSETPHAVLQELVKRVGQPVVRAATRQAMRALGSHFILGQTIEEALQRAQTGSAGLYRYSFDMLGEGARTAADARRYFESYATAIAAIGQSAGNKPFPDRPGISVKLSGLHPRYEPLQRERVVKELSARVLELARQARAFDLNFTVDAEEADRLELSLAVIAPVFADPSLAGWQGFGFAVQAYQKRAVAVLEWTDELASRLGRRIAIRLVKGAYWDTEIKRAQERGLDGYPVFTRKAMTDLSYEACAMRLLSLRARLFPQFATHNALTVGTIVDAAGGVDGYEFQRLHGMGEPLYRRLIETHPDAACRTYAPVGTHRDLLAYLVRRLLENGANSSFVSAARDPSVPIERLLRRPRDVLRRAETAGNPRFPDPPLLFAPGRRNSRGLEFGSTPDLQQLLEEIRASASANLRAAPLIDGSPHSGVERVVKSSIDDSAIGELVEADEAAAAEAMRAAAGGFAAWSQTSSDVRAQAIERASDLLEAHRGRLIHLLQVESGKTLGDGLSEMREAVDFCRYYAAEGRRIFGEPVLLPGPVGESNALALRGRGVFVAISPWNFPLSIFVGQIAAALMAGNSVVAKPAEQTPLMAAEMVRLLHEAGVPASALHLLPGGGALGGALVAHRDVAGVVFTGSTQVAHEINRVLAAKDGPIVPLIAETGGINAMIVDATALPELVTDDVLSSAFRSAGQRCSALRLLCIQDDVADAMLEMIVGAARELKIGDPRDLATDVGPIIDAEARQRLDGHIAKMKNYARRVCYAGEAPSGLYVAPHIFELEKSEDLTEEVFGPILHVVRFADSKRAELVQSIAATGYGLTLGIHSRIQSTADEIVSALRVGNVYVNRNMIGAVVGVQPFGGHGLSGTGPKAGGPHYLPRFATEQTVTINTAAAGGNASLFVGE
jgi:RHH-type transcriptional regulator, proline utilization regulon repressor / proline dehydrogenase / delta 1-pyrroline-5-carboxylate dehydrogenase